jgi:dipeptidyl aminopeptidase/acylaminoacyl peptidase
MSHTDDSTKKTQEARPARMDTVQQVAFEGPLGTLRGLLHRPRLVDQAVPAVVLLHGFTGQHIEDHRLFVQAARHLAGSGFAVLRFDFYGSGDSDGDFEEFTVPTEVADAVAALDWFAQQPGIDAGRIGVVGLSLGGCVTALLAGQDARVKAVVFWNAVALPDLHFKDLPQDGIRGGLRIGPEFLKTFVELDIAGTLRRYTGPGLVIRGTAGPHVSQEEAEALKAALGERGELRSIAGAGHTFLHPDWRREVFTITSDWLAEHLKL